MACNSKCCSLVTPKCARSQLQTMCWSHPNNVRAEQFICRDPRRYSFFWAILEGCLGLICKLIEIWKYFLSKEVKLRFTDFQKVKEVNHHNHHHQNHHHHHITTSPHHHITKSHHHMAATVSVLQAETARLEQVTVKAEVVQRKNLWVRRQHWRGRRQTSRKNGKPSTEPRLGLRVPGGGL